MFLDKVADDDISVTSDIDAAILEKSASFSPLHDIGAIKEALAKHEDKKPVSQTPNEDLTKKNHAQLNKQKNTPPRGRAK